jgi:hypothetical protein
VILMDEKTGIVLRYAFSVAMIAGGLLVNHFNLGSPEFTVYGSFGTYLVFMGFLMAAFLTARTLFVKKKKVVDERMEFVASKAARVTFLALVVVAFAVIVVDGLVPIRLPYHLAASYLVCGLLIVYYASYQVLLRKH